MLDPAARNRFDRLTDLQAGIALAARQLRRQGLPPAQP
jgi:hypothetical protein